MPTAETLRALIALVEEAKAGSRELDGQLTAAFDPPMDYAGDPADIFIRMNDDDCGVFKSYHATPASYTQSVLPLTTCVDAARALAAKVLPDFWMSSGLCSLTGHASIGPDYNGPAGDRLRAEWPEADFHSGFDADLKPGDGPHRECYAILSCMLQAMLARALLQQSETAHVER